MPVNTTKMDALKANKQLPYNMYYMKDYAQADKEAIFWAIIEAYDWDTNHRENIQQVQRHMVTRFDDGMLMAASTFARDKQGDLYEVVDKYEKANDVRCGDYGGDDSFSDMLSHAVSMGHDYFHNVLEDPTVLNDLKYRECFSYVLVDSSEDTEKFHVYKHRRKAYTMWAKLNYHKEYYVEKKDMTVWAKLAVMFDNVLEAIGDQVEDKEDMDLLWATVGNMRDRELYSELGAFGYEYPNVLKDMCEQLFDWDNVGEVQLELF